jgi:hypothetical protein
MYRGGKVNIYLTLSNIFIIAAAGGGVELHFLRRKIYCAL